MPTINQIVEHLQASMPLTRREQVLESAKAIYELFHSETGEKKGHFDVLKEMALHSEIGKIIALPDVVEIVHDKKGGRISMGAPIDVINKIFLNNGKFIFMLYVIDNTEYQKLLKS